MSMTACKKCGFWIDTDENPECYYLETEDGKEIELDYALCENCKEKILEKEAAP